jgi:hypothetical protein
MTRSLADGLATIERDRLSALVNRERAAYQAKIWR